MRVCQLLVALLLSSLFTSWSMAQDFDVSPFVSGNKIATNGFADATNQTDPGRHVFSYEVDPTQGYFTMDPGFTAFAGSGLPSGQQLSFNVLNGASFAQVGDLTYWNGSGPVSFGAVPSSETLRLNFGVSNITVTGAASPVPGFSLGTIASDGSIHRHVSAFLNGSGGNNPADGIYLLGLELTVPNSGLKNSAPLYVLYNNGLTDAQSAAAHNYANTLVVPEPGAFLLAFIGCVMACLLCRNLRH